MPRVGTLDPDTGTFRPMARPLPGQCMRCGTRLFSPRRGTVIHEVTGTIRCPDVSNTDCRICRAPALYQCDETGCETLAHPDCLGRCTTCQHLFCPPHLIDMPEGPMCAHCADHHALVHREEIG